jgi:integrase
MASIDADAIVTYLHAERLRGAAGWTLRGRLTVLSGVFSHAIRRLGHAGSNPVATLGRHERPSISDERPKRILTNEEITALVAHADDGAGLLIETMARTGLRIGEVLGLLWADVTAGELAVTRQLNDHGNRVPLKTERSKRRVDLSAQLATKLREHRVASPSSGEYDLVFTRRDDKPYTRKVAASALARAARGAGLEGVEQGGEWLVPRLTCHSLRHSHISALIAAGWDIQEIADRAGDSVGTIMAEYAHQFDAARRAQSRRDRLGAMEAPMEASGSSTAQQTHAGAPPEVADLQAKRNAAQ